MPDPLSSVREAWRIDRAGSLNRLHRVSEPIPPPRPGDARVAVKAIGLNFADVFACLGLYSATPGGSFVPGLEFAGIIDALGPHRPDATEGPAVAGESPDATPDAAPALDAAPTLLAGGDAAQQGALRQGTHVFGLTRFGGYATALNADTRFLRPLPNDWSFEEGAAFPVQALTAWYGLVRLGRVENGEVVLVHSAAGGVGLNAVRILRTVGARVIATVGHPAKQEVLAQHAGLERAAVIVRDRARFGAQLDAALRASGATGLDVAFDAIAGPFFTSTHARLRPEGRHVIYGAADFMTPGARPDYLRLLPRYLRRPRLDPVQMIAENRSVLAFNLIWLWDAVERLASGYDALQGLITEPPFIGRTFTFDALPEAMRWLQGGESTGKVVVNV
jgi:NADPH:quinone reductase-like Zn-dependent oxidoreductase